MMKHISRKNIIIILGIVIGILAALIISYRFPTTVRSIINILQNYSGKLFSMLPEPTVTIIFRLDYRKERKKR